jgi:protein SCO1/2
LSKGPVFVCLLVLFGLVSPLPAANAPSGTAGPSSDIGVEEQLGATVPLDLTFLDENGKQVSLRDLAKKPIILSLVYYSCPNICPRILSSIAQLLGKVPLVPGKDFSVVTISFDERDTPLTAREKKKDYLKAIGKPYPPEAWRFLTGDRETILRLTNAVGFHFQRSGDAFEHPACLIVLSPKGKVIRYLYGLTYLPFDIKMAVTEAAQGRPGPTIRRALLFCFSYDPQGRTYVFNLLKVCGTVTVVFALMVLAFVLWPRKKGADPYRRQRPGGNEGGIKDGTDAPR